MQLIRAKPFLFSLLGVLLVGCTAQTASQVDCEYEDDIFFITLKAKTQFVSLNPVDLLGESPEAIERYVQERTKEIENKVAELSQQSPSLADLSAHEKYVVDLLRQHNPGASLSICDLRKIRLAVWFDDVISKRFTEAALKKDRSN